MDYSPAHNPPGHIASWQPGKTPRFAPADIAWRLEPDTDLVLQVHFRSTGKPETVQPRIGLYFSKEPPEREPYVVLQRARDIDVPPGQADYDLELRYPLPVDVTALAIQPHAHYLCRRFEGLAVLPDGTERSLLLIDDWNPDWQGEYVFREPVFLARGTTLVARIRYDNSERNPRNPNQPPVRVRWGEQIHDEMGELAWQLLPRDAHDLPRLITDFSLHLLREGERHYARVVAKDPRDQRAHANLAKSLLGLRRMDEAVAELETALALLPPDHDPYLSGGAADLRYHLGLARVSREEYALARPGLEQAVRDNPSHFAARQLLGVTRLRTGDFAGAAAEFEQALRINPRSAQAEGNLGLALLRLARPREALPHLETALRALPTDPQLQAAAQRARQQILIGP